MAHSLLLLTDPLLLLTHSLLLLTDPLVDVACRPVDRARQ
jgi:hypothetical protein